MSPEVFADDQAGGLRRRAVARCDHLIALGGGDATATVALGLAQGCTQAWGSALVADPAAICFSAAGVQPLFSTLDERAVTEAAGCRLLLPPAQADQGALLRFAEQTGARILLYLAPGEAFDLPSATAELRLVVLGHESAAETAYAWLKTLAMRDVLEHALVFWLGSEAGYLRLAETARRFLCAEIAGEICLPGADPACAARALTARMREGGQIWSRVRLHA